VHHFQNWRTVTGPLEFPSVGAKPELTTKPLKTELHHWWPRSLSEHWEDTDEMVSRIRPDGSVKRAPHGNFGAITNAHHLKLGGWDSTFEPIFSEADTEMGFVVSWLLRLEANHADPTGPRLSRILAQPLPLERQLQLARTVSSLVARSPRTRNTIRQTTEFYRKQFGLAKPEPDKTLIAMNQRGLYDAYQATLQSSGRWAILFSDSREFIFGDGFLHNFPATANSLTGSAKCVLPFTPTITIVFMRPMRHPSEPKLITMRLDDDEVKFFNETVQVYSKDFLFFRSQQPQLIPAFTKHEFYEFRYHKEEWLDALLDDLAQYNLWGPGGTPRRTRRNPSPFNRL
jgi:hypothetical protein